MQMEVTDITAETLFNNQGYQVVNNHFSALVNIARHNLFVSFVWTGGSVLRMKLLTYCKELKFIV
jgi:hypothetical protein